MLDGLGKRSFSRRILVYELVAFASVLLLRWLDELADLPHVLLGAAPTPPNWREALFESVLLVAVAALTIALTLKLFRRIKLLEGMLPTCSSCKKIRDEQGEWRPIEVYIRDRSQAEFSHSICPECAQTLYGAFLPEPTPVTDAPPAARANS